MGIKRSLAFILVFSISFQMLKAQVVLNEGSNRNYTSIADEDGDYPDWVELYNSGYDSVSLLNYSITDKAGNPLKWVLPDVRLAPGQYKTVFCSGKDRRPVSGFISAVNTGSYTPVTGWNTHIFTTPIYWDGTSNILVNTCSYSSAGYTTNSVFNQTITSYRSTLYTFQDGNPMACSQSYGSAAYRRPVMKFNGITVGTSDVQNSPYDYPAPYGNWYWGAKNQMLVRASELQDAGLTAGYINRIAFSVVTTDPNTHYDYIEIHLKLTAADVVSPYLFETVDPNNNLHTNFKISKSGETISLFSPAQVLQSSLFVNCQGLNNSRGSFPDAATDIFLFGSATPQATNNFSATYSGYLMPPVFSVPAGMYDTTISVFISNPNGGDSFIQYTTDGSDPFTFSPVYHGDTLIINSSKVLKGVIHSHSGILPSPIAVVSYLIDVNHVTPVLSVVTDNDNLYGATGIFDNWWYDWQKNAYVDYFDSTGQRIFSQNTGMQIDGGAGGSRSQPQHSFRLELDDGVLGDGPVNYPVIPNRPERNKYSRFYLRNGSNQYLVLPYKDAAQVYSMGNATNNYFSAWRPVTVYINASYFGLYELREKFDSEYFHTLEGADAGETDILSKSYWYGGVLRPVEGSVDAFWESHDAFDLLNPADTAFWNSADAYFDMTYYTDYIIAESWMGNKDWPDNNIKIYRSDKSNYRWRYCLVDMELSLLPNGWSDCDFDHIRYMMDADPANPYINIWLKGIQNGRFRNYFINRFADVMNTAYQNERIAAVEDNMYEQTLTEMQKEFARWGNPNTVPQQMLDFHFNHLLFGSQLTKRTSQVRNHIQTNFELPNQVDVTLDVYPPGSGKISISTVNPESYPWQGVYFNGVPVKIEAIPSEGFGFLNWAGNTLLTDTLNPVFIDTLNAETISFTAFFADFTTIHEPNEQSDFKVYPNPAQSTLFLVNKNEAKYREFSFVISDLSGRGVQKGSVNGSTPLTIDIKSLPSGVYLLRISSPDACPEQLRFVKMR